MFNKKIIILSLLAICLATFIFGATANAQTKVIKKVINKTITPDINAEETTDATSKPAETAPVISAPPPPPAMEEIPSPAKNKGLFGWGKHADVSGTYLMNNRGQQGILGVVEAKASLLFDDPLKLGSKIGLAEDAMEYNLGLGLALGNDVNNNPLFSLPLSAGATLYLKEGSLAGSDPYLGVGLNFNLFGTNQKSGGLGWQLYVGTMVDWGWWGEKTGISLGYDAIRVADDCLAEGIFLAIKQPVTL